METTYLLKTKFLTKAGKERTYTFKDVAPELGIELLDEGMCQLAELTKLSEDPTEKVVAPLTVALLQQNTQVMVDHSQDGTMLERRRLKLMEELFAKYCQDHHLSQRHLNDQQIEAICDQLMPYVLLKYPEPCQRRQTRQMLGQPRKNLREQAQKYQFEEMQFPTIKQLTQQSVAKSCGMLKDYFVKGGDAERFIEGIRALQLREFITQKPLLTDEIFRFELEGLYEESDWSDHLREFFDMMVVLMGQLKQVQLKQRVLRENRLLGLRQVVAEGKAAVAQMKEEWTSETAEVMGGTAACGVTV